MRDAVKSPRWELTLYHVLLHLFPRPFRSRFGLEMEELFALHLESSPTVTAKWRLWSRALADVIVQGAAERMQARYRTPFASPLPPSDPMGTLLYSLRSAWRSLSARPGFTIPVVLTLGLGIGLASTMVVVVNGVLLRPLPYPAPERLLRISERTEKMPAIETSLLTFGDWRQRSTYFDAMAAVASRHLSITGGVESVRVPALFVTADYFRVTGVEPFKGRVYGADENREGVPPVVVVSHQFWRETLGAPASLDHAIIGLDDLLGRSERYQVVGVMPAGFDLMGTAQVYVPLERGIPWGVRNHAVQVIGRLKPGVASVTAIAQLRTIQAGVRAEHPDIDAIDVSVESLADEILGPIREPLLLLVGSAGLLLLIAFTNVAGVLLARGIARQSEMRLRAVLGASRRRLVGQLVVESVLLASIAAVIAAVVARALFLVFGTVDPALMPRLQQVAPSWFGLAMVAGLLASCGVLLFGVSSALFTSRWASGGLRTRGGTAQRGQRAVWRSLLGFEVALAFMLLIAAGLLGRSLWQIASVDTGVDATNVATVEVVLPAESYADRSAQVRYFDRALGALRAIPGVEAAGLNIILPLANAGSIGGPVYLEGNDATDLVAEYRLADAGYFAALRIPLIRGRLFDERDRAEAPHAAIINSTMAQRFWGDTDPIGKRFNIPGMDGFGSAWLNVVGVVADARPWNVDAGSQLMYYVSYRQRPTFLAVTGGNIVVRGSGTMVSAPAIRDALKSIDPAVPLRLSTLPERLERDTADKRFILTILGLFAGLALVLSAVGIWSVCSFVISRRVREMGIRLAIGATPRQVRRLLQREALIPLVAGLAGGALLAFATTRWIQSLLFGIGTLDAFTFGAAAATLSLTTWIASYLPARRTAQIDPSRTLQAE